MAIYTSIAFKDGDYDYECNAAGTGNNIIEKIVLVNGSEEDNSFTLVISHDWIVCRRERNKLYITIKRNYNEDDRVGYLNVTSTQDNRAEVSLKITQGGDVFGIDTHDTIELSFKPKCEINEDTKEIIPDEQNVTVTVSGGNGKFGIKRIDKHLSGNVPVDYDYGLKVEKNDTGITVISYGKVPTEENFDHYEIILYHLDKPEITAKINVLYSTVEDDITWLCDDTDVLLPVVSGITTVDVLAKNNGDTVDWSVLDVVKGAYNSESNTYVEYTPPEGEEMPVVDWLKCSAATNALVLEYGEAEINSEDNKDYIALVTLECYGKTTEIVVRRNTTVQINTVQHIPPVKRDTDYPVGIIILNEVLEDVYVETPVEDTVSLIVPWDVGEFDIPLVTRFYENEYTPIPTYDSNILINNKCGWMSTTLSVKSGEVYSEPIDGEEQVYYGTIQIKVLTIKAMDNYGDMNRIYSIRLRDAQAPSNTIYLKITQKAFDPDSSDDSSDDSSID